MHERHQDANSNVNNLSPDEWVNLVWGTHNLPDTDSLHLEHEVNKTVDHTNQENESKVIAVFVDSQSDLAVLFFCKVDNAIL